MRKSVVGLLIFGGLMGGGLMPQTAHAAKSYQMNWMHPRAHNTFKFRKSGYKHYAYTLHKVKHNRYQLKRAYRLGTMKRKIVHQVKAISLGGRKLTEYTYVTYKGKGVWVNTKYLTGSRSRKSTVSLPVINPQTAQQVVTQKANTPAKPKQTGKKVTTPGSQSPSTKSGTTTTTTKSGTTTKTTTGSKLYIKDTKHLSWQQWLSLPNLKGEVTGLTFYYVDDVPYDEDGFPYVTQSMFSVPMQTRIMKNDFTPTAYKAITDKWDTYYVSEKHALFCPTNTEVGQAIRDKMPD